MSGSFAGARKIARITYCVPPAEAATDGGEPFGLAMVLELVEPMEDVGVIIPGVEPMDVLSVVVLLMEPVGAGSVADGVVMGAGVVAAGVDGMAAGSSFLPQAPSASSAERAMAVTAADL